MFYFKYIFKEILNNKRFCFLFVINLSIGLTGLISIDGFKSSLNSTINQKSKTLLGADFGLSARRPIVQSELDAVQKHIGDLSSEKTKMVEVFSMVKSDRSKRSRLMQIRAIEINYPFYGDFLLKENKITDFQKSFSDKPIAFVHPEVIDQLSIEVGDEVKIGSGVFTVKDVVEKDSASGVSSSVAPRIYIHLENLKKTELLKLGSLAWYSNLYKIEGVTEKKLEELSDSIFETIESQEVQVYTHKKASEQLSALVSRLNDFLGLNSVVALFLAFIGAFFLVRSYFFNKFNQVAILMSLGLSPFKAFLFYLTQILVLGFLSSLLASLLSFFIVPILGGLSKDLLPFELKFFISLETFFYGFIVGVLGALFISLPLYVNFKKTKPIRLLDGNSNEESSLYDLLKQVIYTLPLFILFYFLSVRLSNSYQIGSLFIASILFSSFILGLLSLVLFREYKFSSIVTLRWAFREINRNKKTTLVTFLSIGIGSLLLNLTPQIKAVVEKDLIAPESRTLPTFFMFDIQEEQVSEVQKVVKDMGAELNNLSPVIRSRLIKVNGEDFSKGLDLNSEQKLTREQERELRFRNRGFNLSYRDSLDESERIIRGEPFKIRFDDESNELPGISMETRFAKRLNFKIGDRLEFEIDGLSFEGKIQNIRSVNWASFQPNFFIQFQPGSLDLAPKTYIASVQTDSFKTKMSVQDKIVENLPNVSIVDISKVVNRIVEIMNQMLLAIQFMSLICILVGLIVIYSISNHLSVLKRKDIGLMKAVGIPLSFIRNQFLIHFSLIAATASLFGVLMSLVASFVVTHFIFESSWIVAWTTPLYSFLGVLFLSVIVTYIGVRRSLMTKTTALLGID
jgi:putative ABC transport system permease protein